MTDEIAVGRPSRLNELELPRQMRADQEEDAAALGAGLSDTNLVSTWSNRRTSALWSPAGVNRRLFEQNAMATSAVSPKRASRHAGARAETHHLQELRPRSVDHELQPDLITGAIPTQHVSG